MTNHPFINGAAHHTIHHLYFNFNFGQYFTIWDRLGGTHRDPNSEQRDRKVRYSKENMIKESLAVEAMLKDAAMKDDYAEYQVEDVRKQFKLDGKKEE
jgi:lathosterol oxidase